LKTRTSIVLLLSLALVLALASPSWAPRSWAIAEVGADCSVLDATDTSRFTLSLDRFVVDRNGVTAVQGTVTGECAGVTFPSLAFETPVEVGDASCDGAEIELADTSVFEPRRELSIEIELSDPTVIIPGDPTDKRLRGALCGLARLSESASARAVVRALNRVLG
jgi:hypothetical protein